MPASGQGCVSAPAQFVGCRYGEVICVCVCVCVCAFFRLFVCLFVCFFFVFVCACVNVRLSLVGLRARCPCKG